MHPALAEFITQAQSYCALIEDPSPADPQQFAHQCLGHLLRLSDLAMQLPPDLESGDDQPVPVDPQQRKTVEASISKRLPADCYWQVYHPLPLEQDDLEPCVGSLADDLADIWSDLKPGFASRSSFEHHWGKHAADAIPVLYSICYGQQQRLSQDANDIRRISSSQRRRA